MREEALIVDDIGELDRELWNTLVADHPAARYELLSTLDARQAASRHRYAVIASADGYRCAARLTFPSPQEGPPFGRVLFGRAAPVAAALGFQIRNASICRWFPCHGNTVLTDRRLPQAERIACTDAMLDVLEPASADRTMVFPDVLPQDTTLAEALARRGFAAAAGLPIAYLDVQWNDLEGYLAALKRGSKSWKNAARSEINRHRSSGAIVQRLSVGGADYDRVCELLNRHHERLNAGDAPNHVTETLRRLHEALGQDCVIHASIRDGVMSGACVAVRHGSVATLLWVGVDHEAAGPDFAYFNLAFYTPAEEYAKLGVRRVWFGNAAFPAKIRRGCRLTPSRVYVRYPRNSVAHLLQKPVFAVQRAWYRRKFAGLPGMSDA